MVLWNNIIVMHVLKTTDITSSDESMERLLLSRFLSLLRVYTGYTPTYITIYRYI